MLTDLAFARDRLVLAAIALLALGGLALLPGYPSQEDPVIPVNEAMVTAFNPGLDLAETEAQLARPMERAVRAMPETKSTTATVRAGSVHLQVEIRDGTPDYGLAWERLRARLAATAAELPAGTVGPLLDAEFGRVAVATLALTAPDYANAEMRREALALRDRLATLPGVERVTLHGLAPERVTVEVSPLALAQHGLSPSLLATMLAAENILLPGGRVTAEGLSATLDAGRGLRSLDDIAALRVTLPNGGGAVALGEIATVRRGQAEPLETAAFYDGQRAVVFGISMTAGLDVRGFTRGLRAALPAIEATLPVGFTLAVLTDQGEVVAERVGRMGGTLLETVAVVALVVVLALGLRGGLVVAASAPLTMLVSLVVLRAMGMELNSVSIAAFIIALGILVDNANVVVDEAARRMALGETPESAARAAGRLMTLPLLIASLTCILAFAPPLFTDNLSAIYMRVLTVVMAVTLLVSWTLSLTVTPLLAARFVRPAAGREGRLLGPLGRGYDRALGLVLARPLAFCVAMMGLLAATFGAAGLIPSAFLPHADRPQFQLRLEAQPGTDTDRMAAFAADVSAWLADRRENPDIAGALAYVGEGGPRFIPSVAPPLPAPHRAFVVVNIAEGADAAAVTFRLRRDLAARFPELNAEPRLFSMGGNEVGIAMVRLSSHDTVALGEAAARLLDAIRAIPGVLDPRGDWDAPVWRLRVETDPAAARRSGVTA